MISLASRGRAFAAAPGKGWFPDPDPDPARSGSLPGFFPDPADTCPSTLLPVLTAILLCLRSTLNLRLFTCNICFLDGEKLSVRIGVSFGWANFGLAR